MALIASLIWIWVGASCSQSREVVAVQVGSINAYVEVAATESDRQQGLMHRTQLEKDHGMLLIFPETKPVSLWMLNTPLPLDVGFFDEQGRLLQVLGMKPDGGRTIYKSKQPARYALEMAQGWFARHSIKEGAQLSGKMLASLKAE